jgi:hypothetical protein
MTENGSVSHIQKSITKCSKLHWFGTTKGMGCFSDDPALLIKAAEFLQARTKEQAPARRNY